MYSFGLSNFMNNDIYTNNPPNGLRVLDLFCGCGGLSLGFKRAGFNIVGGIDNDKSSIDTFNHNIGLGFIDDLSDKDWPKRFKVKSNNSPVDILIGGPPCQGYSLTGTRDADDERNKLYNAMFVGIDAFKPKAVVIENVRGMATLYGGAAKSQVTQMFESLGYDVQIKILDSANYFVPQHRLRLFFIATLPEYSFSWPIETNDKKNYVTCSDALSDLPSMENSPNDDESEYLHGPRTPFMELMRQNSQIATNHKPTVHKQFVIDTIKLVPEGGNHKDLPAGVGESRKFNEAWTRYHSQKPSRTIDTGHRNHFHYKFNRVPTIRENARLQSFPDTFKFLGSKTSQNRQVGNAVPVFLAQSVANELAKSITK